MWKDGRECGKDIPLFYRGSEYGWEVKLGWAGGRCFPRGEPDWEWEEVEVFSFGDIVWDVVL